MVCRTVLIRQLLYCSDSGASIDGLNVEKKQIFVDGSGFSSRRIDQKLEYPYTKGSVSPVHAATAKGSKASDFVFLYKN